MSGEWAESEWARQKAERLWVACLRWSRLGPPLRFPVSSRPANLLAWLSRMSTILAEGTSSWAWRLPPHPLSLTPRRGYVHPQTPIAHIPPYRPHPTRYLSPVAFRPPGGRRPAPPGRQSRCFRTHLITDNRIPTHRSALPYAYMHRPPKAKGHTGHGTDHKTRCMDKGVL